MSCVAPSAQSWRNQVADWTDEHLEDELRRAWDRHGEYMPNFGPPFGRIHHDWTNFRTVTLREARKRGLDLSVTRVTRLRT